MRPGEAPGRPRKIAIFTACSRNNAHVEAYHRYIGSRPDYVYLRRFSYPDDLVAQSEAAGVRLG